MSRARRRRGARPSRARSPQAPRGVIPARGQGDAAARIATFKAEAARAAATLSEVASPADVPAEIARYLRERNLPATLRMGADPRLAALPWDETALEIAHGRFRRPRPQRRQRRLRRRSPRPARWRWSPAPTTRRR